MGLVRYRRTAVSAAEWGWLEDGTLYELDGEPPGGFEASSRAVGRYALLAPAEPTKVVGVGRNYAEHARELGNEVPERPLLFLKPPSAVIGDGEDIVFPRVGESFSYEAELAVVIGRTASRISEAEAREHILGYTCATDVTIRDLQKTDGQWARAKGFDRSCPLGREVAPELPEGARVRGYLNGEPVQDGPVEDMVFGVDYLVSYISQAITLVPGDVILTGTPAGVGLLREGDEFRVEVPGVSELSNRVAGRRA
jgi:2-keto-4-pentenoate hydratase/2-oxohepta-3-ene-1,7-dioic acid hydratase in catechol pathway